MDGCLSGVYLRGGGAPGAACLLRFPLTIDGRRAAARAAGEIAGLEGCAWEEERGLPSGVPAAPPAAAAPGSEADGCDERGVAGAESGCEMCCLVGLRGGLSA